MAAQDIVSATAFEAHSTESRNETLRAIDGAEVGCRSAEHIIAPSAHESLDVGPDQVAFAPLTIVGDAVGIGSHVADPARVRDRIDVWKERQERVVKNGLPRRSATEGVGAGAAIENVDTPRAPEDVVTRAPEKVLMKPKDVRTAENPVVPFPPTED